MRRACARNPDDKKRFIIFALTQSRECVPDRDPQGPQSSFTQEDANRARSGRGGTSRDRETSVIDTVKIFSMNEIIILSSARKAVLSRLSFLGRHFCTDDINEMVSMTVERFYTKGAYDPSKASVRTYVSRIASNVVYDFVVAADRDRSRFRSLDAAFERDPDGRPNNDPSRDMRFADTAMADSLILDMENESRLMRARERLSPRFRECYDLLAEGKSLKEIAGLKGTSQSNAGVVAYRMRQQLRDLLAS